jgi:PAS domain S-box-containing protein
MLKHNTNRLVRLSESLSSLGSDFDQNINQLTALCGELLNARCALYTNQEDGILNSIGQWQTPPGFKTRDAAPGHICFDLIAENKKEVVLINNLSKTSYVETDPFIKSYALQTFLGRVIRTEAKPIGVLALFYQVDFHPTDEDRRILGIIASAIGNEDTRKQLTQALLKSERLLNKIENISKIGGWEYDENTKKYTWTREAYRIYGVQREFDPNQTPQVKFFIDSDQQLMERAVTNAINRGEPYDLELRSRAQDGSSKWVRMIGSPVFEDGKITRIVGNIVDITERKNNEQALKASEAKLKEINATKDKFFSIIAHDLKNPFNGILGFSNILKEEAKDMDLPTIQEYADMINRAATQVFRLLENLLSWARVQQGQIAFNPTTISLKEIANEEIDLLKENAYKKKIKILDNIPEKLLVKADADMLKTIFRNLISNAIKFTAGSGQIELSAVEKNNQVEVSVKDNGKGMTKENASKLFKIDTNYITRGTEEEEGTGLGLILCKEFVEKHQGTIWVESELDRGSTFKFTLSK